MSPMQDLKLTSQQSNILLQFVTRTHKYPLVSAPSKTIPFFLGQALSGKSHLARNSQVRLPLSITLNKHRQSLVTRSAFAIPTLFRAYY